jgi:hypothetical protein
VLASGNLDNKMPEKETQRRAADDKRKGKSASTQAGEYVHEEIEHIREGKHGARSAKQAIAIGLSKARRAGVKVLAPTGNASEATRKKAQQDADAAKQHKAPSRNRSLAVSEALKHEGHSSVSKKALSAHAKTTAKKRSASDRSAAARKAARTKGDASRSAAAKKATRTREAHQ